MVIWFGSITHAQTQQPDWIDDIRSGHPRLFVNDVIKEVVLANARGREKAVFATIKARVDSTIRAHGDNAQFILHEGVLPEAIVVYWVTGEQEYLEQSLAWLRDGIDHLEELHARKKGLGHFSFMRIGVLMGYDWLYEELPEKERRALGKRLMDHIEAINHEGPYPPDHNGGFPHGGFYGVDNLLWFAGLVFFKEGIDDDQARAWVLRGYRDYELLAEHRSAVAGDDGGVASAVVGYALGANPRAEWNFLHTFHSAIGLNRAEMFDYLALFPNWIVWATILGQDNLYHWGTGDSYNIDNILSDLKEYHLRQVLHFWGGGRPEMAGLAQFLMDLNPSDRRGTYFWGELYPLLLPGSINRVEPLPPDPRWPRARYFEGLGHTYMRSSFAPDATYAVFLAGGMAPQHQHYDAGHFSIYKHGFQAIRRGTRDRTRNRHMTEFYQRTIAHNTLLIRMPGEEFPHHWGYVPVTNDGGQTSKVGAKVIAFETNDRFSYIVADLTDAYNERKVDRVVRHFLFLHPNHFVVLDDVISVEAEYPKTWLLHTMREPTVDGTQFSANWNEGVLHCRTLLPANAKLEAIGGEGSRFLVDGRNFPIDPAYLKRQLDRRSMEFEDALAGHWRVQITPHAFRKHDMFLHVIEVGRQDESATMKPVRMWTEPNLRFIEIEADSKVWRFSFDPEEPMDATIAWRAQDVMTWDQPHRLTREVHPQAGLALRAD